MLGWKACGLKPPAPPCLRRFTHEPSAPSSVFAAPYTSVPTLDCSTAPAHMGHGSRVTYSVASRSSCQPTAAAPERRHSISACAVGSPCTPRVSQRRAVTRCHSADKFSFSAPLRHSGCGRSPPPGPSTPAPLPQAPRLPQLLAAPVLAPRACDSRRVPPAQPRRVVVSRGLLDSRPALAAQRTCFNSVSSAALLLRRLAQRWALPRVGFVHAALDESTDSCPCAVRQRHRATKACRMVHSKAVTRRHRARHPMNGGNKAERCDVMTWHRHAASNAACAHVSP